MATQEQKRREAFEEAGREAREHADQCLEDIDAVLAEEDRILKGLGWMAEHGWMAAEQVEDKVRAFHDDPLANPLEPVTDWPD